MEVIDNGVIQVQENGLYRHIHPSIKVDGEWQDTDISGETEEVQTLCNETWTDSVKQEYQDHIDLNLVVEE